MLRNSLGVVLVVVFWAGVFIINALLKKYRKYSRRYRGFLENHGITVSFCHLKWYTARFNRYFVRFGQFHPHFLHLWFSFGVWVGVVLMVTSVIVLSTTLSKAFRKDDPEQVLMPVMPGVNLPWSQVLHYLITLTVSGVFHEVGHAVAAVREQVRVNGFGMFFTAIYPGAFVDLYTEHLTVISPARQLRIYCAGVWHNAVLVVLGMLTLWLLPYILVPLYMTGQGAMVIDIMKDSPVSGSLQKGDTILSVYGCPVFGQADWYKCMSELRSSPQHGYCSDMISITGKNSSRGHGSFINGVFDCCQNSTSTRFCFEYTSLSQTKGFACLPARSTMQTRQFCHQPQECPGPGEKVCVKPSLDNSSRLIRIIRNQGSDVLYVGDPLLLQYSVSVISYSPRSTLLPVELPITIETFLIYLVSLSGALALLNVVPCYSLDGQWVLFALVDDKLASVLPDENQRNTLCNVILTLGTLLLGANIILALWTLVTA